MKQIKVMHKLAAIITAGMMAGQSGAAYAADTNFTDVTSKIQESTSTLPNLISQVSYIGGIGLGVAGIFKLKQHVDNPAQVMMKDGLVRLGAGGGLLTLPYITKAMQGTVGTNSSGAAYSDVNFGAASGG